MRTSTLYISQFSTKMFVKKSINETVCNIIDKKTPYESIVQIFLNGKMTIS
jgi:hypothetical protein